MDGEQAEDGDGSAGGNDDGEDDDDDMAPMLRKSA